MKELPNDTALAGFYGIYHSVEKLAKIDKFKVRVKLKPENNKHVPVFELSDNIVIEADILKEILFEFANYTDSIVKFGKAGNKKIATSLNQRATDVFKTLLYSNLAFFSDEMDADVKLNKTEVVRLTDDLDLVVFTTDQSQAD